MFECTRRIEFDAGHRVIGHKNKCKYLHGHRYALEITAKSANLDELGMVADFGELKGIIKSWIDSNLDHNTILSVHDRKLGEFVSAHTGQTVYFLNDNPTAENIAMHIKNDIVPQIFEGKPYKITKIRLYETPNCFVEV